LTFSNSIIELQIIAAIKTITAYPFSLGSRGYSVSDEKEKHHGKFVFYKVMIITKHP
jgi:hypothetical protein